MSVKERFPVTESAMLIDPLLVKKSHRSRLKRPLFHPIAVFLLLIVALYGDPASAITWVEESPGCSDPLDRGGNCIFWDGPFKPAGYDNEVFCYSPNLKIEDPRAICWWGRRIMGYYLFKDGNHPAAQQCIANSPGGSCNSLSSSRSPVSGWNARYYLANGIVYYYLWRRSNCPDGWGEQAGGECVPPADTPVVLNAGQSSCTAESGEKYDGNPVHVGTGNKYQREVDIPGTSGVSIPFVRHYNSRRSYLSRVAWRHAYQRSIQLAPFSFRRVPTGTPETIPDTIQLRRPDGRTILFYRTGDKSLAATEAEIPNGVPAVGTNQYPLRWTGTEWRYMNQAGDLEYYSEQGELQRIVSRDGYTRRIAHDAEGRVTSVRDSFGRTLVLEYESYRQQPSRIQDAAGNAWAFGYDADRNLTTVTDPTGAVRTYHYGEFGAPPGFLTGITDENGNRYATWKYDDQERAILSEHAGGAERSTFEYLSDGHVRVTDADGGTRTYTTETIRGRMLTSSIENGCASCGNTSDWEYNDLGLPSRKVDRNGNVTTYQYNDYGLETARTEAAGTAAARTITTQWDTELRLPLVVTESGLRTEYTYDGRGRRLSMTETDTATDESRTTSWRYHRDDGDVPGQLAEVDGPRTDVADVTRYEYDAQGNRTRVTNALGQITQVTAHDAYVRALTVVDPNGLVTNLSYDSRGRLLSRDVGGELTRFEYDGVGNLTAVHMPNGGALHYDYDPAQRLVAIADEDGNRIDYTLDAAGNRVSQDVRDGGGVLVRTQQQVFDELDRLVQVVGAQGQTTHHAYDDNGNRVVTTDPAGHATQQAFDALDRITRVTDPMGGVTRYAYDRQDRITSVTDPNGNTTRYTYDGFGNRTEVDSPDSGIATYAHDAAGNVVAQVDAKGQRAEHAYDALNRLVRTDYADGASVVYRWDEGTNGSGRLAAIDETGPDGWTSAIEWSYDVHGRITERSQSANGVKLTTQHRYDSAGRRIETVYPSGRVVAYSYIDDQLTGISVDGTTVLSDIQYQPFGPVAGWIWGDGDVHSREYDLDGRLTQHGLATGSEGGGTRRIDYTADDNIATITGPNIARNYGYDGLDRLVAANDPDRTDAYSYDANGNRLSRTVDGATESYTIEAGSNRLLGVTGAREASYAYDANGSLIDDSEHTYAYSARNRLISVDGGTTAIYRYNALGQRIYKRTGSGIDYAALVEEYQALADEHRAEAESLQQQADQKRAAGDAAAAEAERLRTEAESLRTQADQNEQAATTLAEEAMRLREEAAELVARAEAKEQEAMPLQQEADRLSAEAAELQSQADAEWQAAEADQAQADELAASAQSRRARAEALDRQAAENDRIAAENRTRIPELGAEADALRAEADETEAAAQPYLREVEKLQRRIDPVQRVVDRFDARIEALRERKVDDPANRRQARRNAVTDRLIGVLERVRGRIQWRLDDWLAEQARYQAQADSLLAEATAMRERAEQKDYLAVELAQEADRLEAEAAELRAEAESERALAAQEEAESEEYARQAQVHREAAQRLDDRAQAKEDEARPLHERAAALRAEAESLRAQAESKVTEADGHEREADRLTQLAAEQRVTAGEHDEQAASLEADAIQHRSDAASLQAEADSASEAANEAQLQADEYSDLAETPNMTGERQYFVYNDAGRLLGRYDKDGALLREYVRLEATAIATITADDTYYAHSDQLGVTQSLSKPNGPIIWVWIPDPFGDSRPDQDPDHNDAEVQFNLRFPGQYFDSESNYHSNVWRSYNPKLGRYITSDPIGLAGGLNPYTYALSNPIQFFDPDGLAVRLICRRIKGIVGDITRMNHCFVYVTCPQEGWSRILSLFASKSVNSFPIMGRKSSATPGTPGIRDNPSASDNVYDRTIRPSGCISNECAYEKDVMRRFLNFPSGDVPYFPLGPNSNSFVEELIESTNFGARVPQDVPRSPGFGFSWE